MLTCKEVARLLSSGEKLDWKTKAALKLHLLMCLPCLRYSKHLEILKSEFKRLFETKFAADPSEVSRAEASALAEILKRKPGV